MGGRRCSYTVGVSMGARNNLIFLEDLGVGADTQRLGRFKCHCGKEFITKIANVKRGNTNGCGCYFKRHGLGKKAEYGIWTKIRIRCRDITDHLYPYYGGRGITMSDEWFNSVEMFYADMGPRPGIGYSIERIDNDKGYCKENCKWATKKEQMRNKRTTIRASINGEVKTVMKWAEIYNIDANLARHRIRILKWNPEKAFSTPARVVKKRPGNHL